MWRRRLAMTFTAARHLHCSSCALASSTHRGKRLRATRSSTSTSPSPSHTETHTVSQSAKVNVAATVEAIITNVDATSTWEATTRSPAAAAPAVPDSVDYRALLLDLLLYRKETVSPVLAALVKERQALEQRMHDLDRKVTELAQLREDIRQLLQEHSAAEERRLLQVVQEIQQSQQREAHRQTECGPPPKRVAAQGEPIEEEFVL